MTGGEISGAHLKMTYIFAEPNRVMLDKYI
jgi:hypothetical protein